MTNTKKLTIKNVKDGFDKKDFSPEELRQDFLELIKKENKKLNAYLNVFDSPAEGDRITEHSTHLSARQVYLEGVPCAIKDNILIDDTRCTAGSKILENYISAYDATVVKKLRDAGAVFLGKTNLDEFAMGSSTENSAYGPTKNPYDLTRVPGGSSGGSAAAVAAGLAVFALGSDTGGSIRLPASFCGVVGLKPTYGRVSRRGLIAMASSLDQIGPITKNVYDAALILNIVAGQDQLDSTTASKEVLDYTDGIDRHIKGLKIGVPKEYFGEGLDDGIENVIQKAISKLQNLGAEIIDISLPHSEYALAAYYIIMPCEVSANLARYDGIKYGFSKADKVKNLLDTYLESRGEGFGEEARRRIMLGTYALSAGYYDAYYLKAQKVRALIKKDFSEAFKKVDVIVGPTAPTVAFKLGEKTQDPLTMYLSDVYTVAINLAGVPAMSVPCGFTSEGTSLRSPPSDLARDARKSSLLAPASPELPVGLQIIGRPFDEAAILRIGYNLEKSLA